MLCGRARCQVTLHCVSFCWLPYYVMGRYTTRVGTSSARVRPSQHDLYLSLFLRPGKHVLCRLNCIRSTLYYEKKGIIVCICPFSSSSFQTEYNNSPPSEKIKPCWRRHSENSQQQQVSLIWMSMRARFTLFLLYIPLILAACVASPWRAFGWQWRHKLL